MQTQSIEIGLNRPDIEYPRSEQGNRRWKLAKELFAYLRDTLVARVVQEEGEVARQSALKEDLLFFIQHGGLRWGASESGILHNTYDIAIDRHFLQYLSAIVVQSDNALNRMLYSCSEDFKRHVANAICSQSNPSIGKLVAILKKIGSCHTCPNYLIILAYALHYEEKAKDASQVSFSALITLLFWSSIDEDARRKLVMSLVRLIRGSRDVAALFKHDTQWQRVVLLLVEQFTLRKADKLRQMVRRKQNITYDERVLDRLTSLKTVTDDSYTTEQEGDYHVFNGDYSGSFQHGDRAGVDQVESNSIIFDINNAGLVIIYPFLRSLFETVGLLKSANHQLEIDRAAPVVLQYILQGVHEVAEHDLPLNKILCGLAPATFVPCRMELSRGCIQACDELLTAVIGHWGALKGMSVEGLRQTFLQRKGRLQQSAMGWRLYVEPKGVDVLLSSLPWDMDVSTIKLPWMDDCLVVEWGT